MENWLYVMMLEKEKTYSKMTRAVVERHVDNIRKLDNSGHLALCGPFKGYPGMAGMFVIKAESYEAAKALCDMEPLVVEGFASYKLYRLQAATKENNYLL